MIKFFQSFLLLFFFVTVSSASSPVNFWPLHYDAAGLPVVNVKIANKDHKLTLDTGAAGDLYLYADDIKQLISLPDLKVVEQPLNRAMNIAGVVTKVPAWKIDRLTISDIPFDNVEIVTFEPMGITVMGEGPPDIEMMGLGLFQDRLVLMDFKNDQLQLLKKLPSDIDQWSSYPLEKTKSGLQLTAFVNNKPLRLMLDTGANQSVLFSDRLPDGVSFSGCRLIVPTALDSDCQTVKITVKDRAGKPHDDFAVIPDKFTSKPQDVNSDKPAMDFDGLLGMSFLRGSQVIIDMPNSTLYMRP